MFLLEKGGWINYKLNRKISLRFLCKEIVTSSGRFASVFTYCLLEGGNNSHKVHGTDPE